MDCCEIRFGQGRSRAARASAMAGLPAAAPPDSIAARSRAGPMALACVAGATASVWVCRTMSAMGEVPMPGGWSMSALWTPMCGQTWLGAATSFVGMWTVMMAAMMLPMSLPELGWLRQRIRATPCAVATSVTLATFAAYALAWAVTGAIVFVGGNTLAATLPSAAALARRVPLAAGLLIVLAGAVQFTAWKARRIACCATLRSLDRIPASELRTVRTLRAACRFGFRLAFEGGLCCANLMLVLLLVGVMDSRAMVAITAAASLERIVPARGRTARAIGAAVAATGVCVAAQAAIGLR